jgi:hypothetical protein
MTWRRLLILDLLLVVLLVTGILKLRQGWFQFEATHHPETIRAAPETARTVPAFRAPLAATGDWIDVSTKDPFSVDRNDVAIVAPVAAKDVAPIGPKPVLFGTMSIGHESVAMLAPSQGGTRQSRAMKVGDSMESWQLVEIKKDSVVMEANGVRATIILNDPAAGIARDYSRTGPSTSVSQVVNAASAPAAPSPVINTPSAPPPPGAPPGTEQKGHWQYTPFGNHWVPD